MKLTWLNEIYYGTMSGGIKNGMIGYVFDFSGEQIDATEASDLISEIAVHRGKKFSRILLKGTFPDSPLFEQLVKSVADLGWELVVTVTDATWRQWYTMVAFISVELHSTSWAPFKCNELIYDVFTHDQADPLLARPGKQPIVSTLYARPINNLSTKDLFLFMEKSPYLWNVYTQAKAIKEILHKTGGTT